MTRRILPPLLAAALLLAPLAAAADPSDDNREGIALFQAGNLEEAVARFETALASAPEDPTVRANLVLCLNNLAVERANAGATRDACFWFEKLRDLAPADGGPLLSYGNLLLRLGEDERALGVLADALERDLPEAARRDAVLSLGASYYKLGRFDEAIGTLEPLLPEAGEMPAMTMVLAQAYHKAGKLESCTDLLREALERGGGAEAEAMRRLLEKVERERTVEDGFATESGARFLIQFEGGAADELVPAVRDALEEAYREVGAFLNLYPDGQLPVIIYSGEQFRRATARPGWVAALFDGKMRLPVGDLTESRERLAAAVRHEYTHLLVHRAAGGRCPTWLNEGLAQMMEGRTEEEAFATVRAAAAAGKVPPLETLEGSFLELSDAAAALAYDLSFLVTKRAADRAGLYTIRELLERMRLESASPREVLEDGLYRTYRELVAEIIDSIK